MKAPKDIGNLIINGIGYLLISSLVSYLIITFSYNKLMQVIVLSIIGTVLLVERKLTIGESYR
jgi:uncharacterized membrane protein